MSHTQLAALNEKWGWATEGADPDRLPDTLRRLELASVVANLQKDPGVIHIEVARLHREGAIRG